MGSRSSTVGRLALVLVGVVAALGVAEVGARLFGYEGQQERLEVVFDDAYGDVEADSWIYGPPLEPGERVEMNNGDHAVTKPEGVWRMLFVGDSGTAGSGVQSDEAFPLVVAAQRADPQLEVINSGVPGLATVGELRLMQERLGVLEPDVVVLGVFMANDLGFNLVRVQRYRVPGAGWLRRRSALSHLLYLRFLAHTQGTALSPSPTEEHGIGLDQYVPGEVASYIAPVSPTFRLAYEVLEETLRRFAEIAERDGFALAVVLLPTLSSLVGHLEWNWEEDNRLWSEYTLPNGEWFDVRQPTREVLGICDRLDLVCVDPTDELAHELGRRAILPNDDHPSAAAHGVIARELARRFDEEPRRFWGEGRAATESGQ